METFISNEWLCFYYLVLSSGLVEFKDYIEELHGLFLADAGRNETLLELEYCTGDPQETIATLKTALYDKSGQIDYQKVGKMLFDELGKQYSDDPDTLKRLTHELYTIWTLLPEDISSEQPFIRLNSIDDYWAWDGKNEMTEQMKYLIDYYNT